MHRDSVENRGWLRVAILLHSEVAVNGEFFPACCSVDSVKAYGEVLLGLRQSWYACPLKHKLKTHDGRRQRLEHD